MDDLVYVAARSELEPEALRLWLCAGHKDTHRSRVRLARDEPETGDRRGGRAWKHERGRAVGRGRVVFREQARVERSVLSPGVYVSPGAIVRDSVVMNDTWIGPGAVLDRVIVDKNVVVGAGVRLGYGDDLTTPNKLGPSKLNTGVSVVGKGAHLPANLRVGRNVVINADRDEEHFPAGELVSGETI